MDTINIINNFDQNILMENILILNQQKLLDLVFDTFEKDFKDKQISELTQDYVKTYFDKLQYINWDLMIRLFNLPTLFNVEYIIPRTYFTNSNLHTGLYNDINYNYDYDYDEITQQNSSLEYIISKCLVTSHTKIIEFLLGLPKELINWENKLNILFHVMSKKLFCSNDNIIEKIINLDLDNSDFWYNCDKHKFEQKNIYRESPIGYLFSNATENQLFEIIKKNIFDINKPFDLNILNKNNKIIKCKKNIINIIIERKFKKILEYIFENNYEINYKINPKKNLINRACMANDLDIIKILIKNGFDFNGYNNENDNDNENDNENDNPIFLIKSESILMYLIKNNNLILTNDIFYHAIKNDWIEIIDYYFEKDIIEWETLNFPWVITLLTINKHFDLISILIPKSIITFYSNLQDGIEMYHLDPHGFWNYDSDNDSDNDSDTDTKYD